MSVREPGFGNVEGGGEGAQERVAKGLAGVLEVEECLVVLGGAGEGWREGLGKR